MIVIGEMIFTETFIEYICIYAYFYLEKEYKKFADKLEGIVGILILFMQSQRSSCFYEKKHSIITYSHCKYLMSCCTIL